jgi:peptidoglycan lytic transglycosylase G
MMGDSMSGSEFSSSDPPPHFVPRSPSQMLQPEEALPPPKRSGQARHGIVVVFNSLISLMVIFAIVAFGVIYFGKLRFEEPGPLQVGRTIVITEGASLPKIAQQLNSAGVIDGEVLFRLGVRAYNAQGELKPGEYAFAPNVSMREVMDTIREGKAVVHKISLPEGLTSHQIFERLRQDETLLGELPTTLSPEGSLMPDTYPYQRGATRAEIVEQMRRAQQQFVQHVWETRVDDLPLSSPEELVTLASIVEKETAKADERPRIAGVFINRLRQGIRLQSDPTIIYGLFGGEGKPADRPIYRSDIDKATPFNTYQIDGLPPGPISNPGRASLEAVANPSRTDELFFVADGTGGHVFSRTLDEHRENVERWRDTEKRMQAEAARAAEEAASGDGESAPGGAAGEATTLGQ